MSSRTTFDGYNLLLERCMLHFRDIGRG